MRIAIIGAGNVGSAIARAAQNTGHDIIVSDAADESHQLAGSLGVPVAETNAEAAQAADAIVLAVPYGVLEDVAEEIAPESEGKIVIDVKERASAALVTRSIFELAVGDRVEMRGPALPSEGAGGL